MNLSQISVFVLVSTMAVSLIGAATLGVLLTTGVVFHGKAVRRAEKVAVALLACFAVTVVIALSSGGDEDSPQRRNAEATDNLLESLVNAQASKPSQVEHLDDLITDTAAAAGVSVDEHPSLKQVFRPGDWEVDGQWRRCYLDEHYGIYTLMCTPQDDDPSYAPVGDQS